MKYTASLLVFLLVFGLVAPAMAQTATGEGRPDPTGRGRYLQYGAEVRRPGATVLKELPAGAKCAPAGELVGVSLWNTTRTDHVIVSRLTDKAEVAMVGNRPFLCYCADGHNELFVPKPATPPAPPATTSVQTRTEVVEVPKGTTSLTVSLHNIIKNDNKVEQSQTQSQSNSLTPPPLPGYTPSKGGNWKLLAGILGGIGAGALFYLATQGGDDDKGEAETKTKTKVEVVVVNNQPPAVVVVVPPEEPTTPPAQGVPPGGNTGPGVPPQPTPGANPGGNTGPGLPSFAKPAKIWSFSF